MEIYRTDGSGKSYNDERLKSLVYDLCKIDPILITKIDTIKDHKGELMVYFNDRFSTNNFIETFYYLFKYLWMLQNEYQVSIFYKSICVIGYQYEQNK